MLNHRLAAAEGAGNCRHAPLGYREQGVYNPLSGYHGLGRGHLPCIGPAYTHRPLLQHGQLYRLPLTGDELGYGLYYVGLAGVYPGELAIHIWRHHYLMEHRFRLLYGAQDIAGLQYIAYLCRRQEIPEPFVVYGVHPDTAGYPVPRPAPEFY